MSTPICPTCGCSLVRLGISEAQAPAYRHNDEEYHFCCKGCVDIFITDPEKYLNESCDLIVCPSCLAEKPQHLSIKLEVKGQQLYFCRCPYCAEVVKKNPDFYVNRLAGTIPNQGAVLDHEGCCIRPN